MPDSNPDIPKKNPSKSLPKQKSENQNGNFSNEADLWDIEGKAEKITLESQQSIVERTKVPQLLLIDQIKDAAPMEEKEEILETKEPSVKTALPAAPPTKLVARESADPSGKKLKALTQTEDDVWDNFLDEEPSPLSKQQHQEPEIDIDSRLAKIPHDPLNPNKQVRNFIRPDVEVNEGDIQGVDHSIKQPEVEMEKKAQSFQIPKFTPVEAIASLFFLALLLIGAIVTVSIFRSHLKVHADPYATPDFPVKGSIATVAKVETFWRTPVVGGATPDTTKLNVILLPVITITLNECKAPQGALRVMFLNHNNEIVGDTLIKSYNNNHFNSTQSATMSFVSTAGFTEFGEKEAYRAKISKPWTIQVFEGPSESADSNSFKLLFTTPIVTNRH